jgi:small subunit ribosomal protein S6
MTKTYELTVLIHSDLETNLETALTKIRDIIANVDGKIIKEDNWCKKKLAYPINKQDFAIYVYFDVELPPQAPQKINAVFNITDEVLRYLLVTVDEKGRKALEEAKANESSKDDIKE